MFLSFVEIFQSRLWVENKNIFEEIAKNTYLKSGACTIKKYGFVMCGKQTDYAAC
jgi:hypothetical protein